MKIHIREREREQNNDDHLLRRRAHSLDGGKLVAFVSGVLPEDGGELGEREVFVGRCRLAPNLMAVEVVATVDREVLEALELLVIGVGGGAWAGGVAAGGEVGGASGGVAGGVGGGAG